MFGWFSTQFMYSSVAVQTGVRFVCCKQAHHPHGLCRSAKQINQWKLCVLFYVWSFLSCLVKGLLLLQTRILPSWNLFETLDVVTCQLVWDGRCHCTELSHDVDTVCLTSFTVLDHCCHSDNKIKLIKVIQIITGSGVLGGIWRIPTSGVFFDLGFFDSVYSPQWS